MAMVFQTFSVAKNTCTQKCKGQVFLFSSQDVTVSTSTRLMWVLHLPIYTVKPVKALNIHVSNNK